MYLHTQRKIIAENVGSRMLQRLRENVGILEKYQQTLRAMATIEEELYGFLGASIRHELEGYD